MSASCVSRPRWRDSPRLRRARKSGWAGGKRQWRGWPGESALQARGPRRGIGAPGPSAPGRSSHLAISATSKSKLAIEAVWAGSRKAALGLVVGVATGASVWAASDHPWVEVRTAHFSVVSNASPAEAQRVAALLEELRATIGAAWAAYADREREQCASLAEAPDLPSPARESPVRVFALAGERDLRTIVPQFWEARRPRPVAVYWPGPHRQFVAVRLDRPEQEWRRAAAHEYGHLVVRSRLLTLPAWLDEGLAELWSTAAWTDRGFVFGIPVPKHLRTLSRRWIPLSELMALAQPPAARGRRELEVFYAEAWALVHYLTLRPDAAAPRRFVPSDYLAVLRAGGEPLRAAREAFGDLTVLEERVQAYLRHGELRAVVLERPAGSTLAEAGEDAASARTQVGRAAPHGRTPPRADPIHVRRLTFVETLVAQAEALVDGERPDRALPLLAQALRADPRHAPALEALGISSFRSNRPDEAVRRLDEAISTGQAGPLAFFYRALLARTDDGAGGIEPERYLERAIGLDPSFAPAYARLASLAARDPRRRDEAIALARRAVALDPHALPAWLDLTRLLAEAVRRTDAQAAGRCAQAAARSPDEHQAVVGLLETLGLR